MFNRVLGLAELVAAWPGIRRRDLREKARILFPGRNESRFEAHIAEASRVRLIRARRNPKDTRYFPGAEWKAARAGAESGLGAVAAQARQRTARIKSYLDAFESEARKGRLPFTENEAGLLALDFFVQIAGQYHFFEAFSLLGPSVRGMGKGPALSVASVDREVTVYRRWIRALKRYYPEEVLLKADVWARNTFSKPAELAPEDLLARRLGAKLNRK